ncbi:MAG: hypothetical protein IJX41_01195 [Bacteroidaceae bacterium]|nr:hypothetical protein [Bacteroidaceae bacterium]
MKMRKTVFSVMVATMLLASCGESADSKAGKLLQQAQEAYEAGEYQNTKLLIDSIRNCYPTAFAARRGALELMRTVEIAEQQRSLDHCNEMIEELSARRDEMLSSFEYEKDGRYQDEGSYILPAQAGRLNVFNSYLRVRVAESGEAYITSLYRGKRIAHRSVKVSANGSYAMCDKAFSSHTYRNIGINNERLDFIYGEDGGIMDFISAATGTITVELAGKEDKYSYTLRAEDAKAVKLAVDLSKVLKSIAEYKEMAAEAQRHIDFVKKTRERFAADSISIAE